MHLNAFFENGRFTMHSKKYIERVGRLRIFKHIAIEDLTKTFATVYYSQANLIWPDIGIIPLGNIFCLEKSLLNEAELTATCQT